MTHQSQGIPTVDPHIWKACAGNSAQIPTVDSRVYYFTQGHAEQSSSPPDFSSSSSSSTSSAATAAALLRPFVLCRISAVRFLASPDSDEVSAKFLLQPLSPELRHPITSSPSPSSAPNSGAVGDAVSFAKILTPSDANNGGGFSVPRFCADSIFPPLNFNADPPVQTISIRDVHGTPWEFRHIYRGTPRRHLLTTGWSKFVNQKKLVAGDSVLFIKHSSGKLFVGVRRVRPSAPSDHPGRWTDDGFWKGRKGKVSPESVAEAARLAAAGRPFEVVYYPNSGCPDFVVRAEAVEEAMKVCWTVGLRVKMAVETEDSSRMTWFQGTVSSITAAGAGMWRGSPWRLLQVAWDEPEVLQNVKRVNPWEVEVVSATPQMHAPFSSPKKMRLSQDPELLADGESPMFFPMMGLSHSVIGSMNPSLFNYNTFPAGMQGARQNQLCFPGLPNFIPANNGLLFSDKLCGNNMALELNPVSTDLNIGSKLHLDNSSAHIEGDNHCLAIQFNANRIVEPKKQSGVAFIQLFGQIIRTTQPVEDVIEDAGCRGDDRDEGCRESEGVSLDYSLSYPFKQLFNQLDPQRPRFSAVGASI